MQYKNNSDPLTSIHSTTNGQTLHKVPLQYIWNTMDMQGHSGSQGMTQIFNIFCFYVQQHKTRL